MTTYPASPLSTRSHPPSPWQPVWEIVRFDLQESLSTRFVWLSFGVFFVLGLLVMLINGTDGAIADFFRQALGNTTKPGDLLPYANSSLALMQTISIIAGIPLAIVVAGIFADRATKDFTSNMDALLFTTPLKEWQFLTGRLIASFVVSLVIFLGVGLGLLVGAALPWMTPARIAPFNLLHYIQPYLYFVIPNILVFGLFSFALGLLTRRTLISYLAIVGLMIAFNISSTAIDVLQFDPFFKVLAQPFGSASVSHITEVWTKVEQNTRTVPFVPAIWLSRLLWLGLSGAFFAWVWQRFSFSGAPEARPNARLERLFDWAERLLAGGRKSPVVAAAEPDKIGAAALEPPAVHRYHGTTAQLHHVWHLARTELNFLIGNPLILAILVISLLAFGLIAVLMVSASSIPTTGAVVNGLRILLLFFAPLLIVFLAGDLVWREREVRVDSLSDPLPVRSWVLVTGKLLAMGLLLLLTGVLLTAGAILAQTANRYTNYQLGVYGIGLFSIALIELLLIAVLSITIQVLVNQKFLGYFLSAALVLVLLVDRLASLIPTQASLLNYGLTPDYYYSDISGYGRTLEPVRWFQFYWLAIALLLLCISVLFWVRGVDTQPRERWRIARQRFTRPLQMVMALSAIAAVCLGGWIYYNTQVVNAGVPAAEAQNQLIAYEKAYGALRDAQPKITAIKIQGDLYPEADSRFAVKGTYTLENKTQKAIDTILINVLKTVEVNQIALNGVSGQRSAEHPNLQVYPFSLASPLQPGASIEATFDVVRKPPSGFETNSKNYDDFLANGTSFTSTEFLPMVGFVDRQLVKDPQTREQAGLPKIDPAAELVRASQYNFNHPDTDRALFSATLSTSADQTILTSGEQVREWTEGNRRYFQYESQVPIQKMVPFVSGRYEVLRGESQGIPVEIYYHKGHDYNVQRILSGAEKGLAYASQNFRPYPYKSLRIVEIPYVKEAQSFAGGQIKMGENLAFLTNLNASNPGEVDTAFRYAAHETAHQWWGAQLIPAWRIPGSRILTESLAEYTANQVYAKEFGQEGLGVALLENLQFYLSNRSQSDVPLIEASDNHLVYQKGSLAMFALQDYLGEDVVNGALAKFLQERSNVPPYPSGKDLVDALRQVTPPRYQYLITDLFETVTLYNNNAESAMVKQRPDGKYDVTLAIKTAKVRSDRNGNETPTEINNEEIDVGVYDTTGKLIYLKKYPFKSGDSTLTITVDQSPQTAGIDPLHKLIDKIPEDNLTAVKQTA